MSDLVSATSHPSYCDLVRKTTVYLPEDLMSELHDAARRSGRSQAELVRDALRAYLDGEDRPAPRSFGRGADTELAARDSKAWLRRQWDRE